MKFFFLVWSNLKRKKVRTFLTFASVLVAFLLFGYLSAIETALDIGVSVAGADRLMVRHKVSLIQPLPESYEAQIEQIDGVVDATPATWFGGVYQEPTNFFMQIPVKPLAAPGQNEFPGASTHVSVCVIGPLPSEPDHTPFV